MISYWILLFIVVVGWIISGSLVPMISAVSGLLLLGFLLLVRFSLSRILIATGVMLLMTMQAFAFQKGYAGLIYEDLPITFHAGMGCYLWAAMVIMMKDGSRKQVGGWVFILSLAGGVFLFAAAASVEIFRFSPFWVRCLATLPLAITLLQEFCRHSPVLSRSGMVALGLATPLLGMLCHASRPMSDWMKNAIEIKDKIVYDFSESDGSGTRGRVDLTGGDGVVTLARRASISVDKNTRFFLKFSSLEDFLAVTRRPIYLRTSTVAIFDGNDKILPVSKGKWLLDGDDGISDQITTLPERARVAGRSLEYAIVLPKADTSLIPLIEGTNQIRADEIFHFSEGRYQLGQDPGTAEWMRFSAIGPADERPFSLKPATSSLPPGDVHLTLPDTDLIRQIRALTSRVTSGKTPHLAIAEHIKNQCRYSLEYKNPKNLSPVENLLFAEKKGHCELFATATVMMLRSAGVPSRIAYGYAGGASNRDQLAIAFRGIDIHAWAEILTENGEWRIFDTTPPDRGPNRIATSSVSGKIDWKMAAFDPAAPQLPGDEGAGLSGLAAAMAALSDWAGAHYILLTGGLLLFGLLARWTGARWFGNQPGGPGENTPAFDSRQRHKAPRPDFVKEILALGARAGITRQPGTTLREFVKTLQPSLKPKDSSLKPAVSEPVAEEINRAVEYYYQIRYGGGEVDESFERSVSRMIRELKIEE